MSLPANPAPSLHLHIDEEALGRNWKRLDTLSGTARAGAAIKANAYGLGAERVAPILHRCGVEDFFIAHWSEASTLLDHIAPRNISVLHGPRNTEEAAFARSVGLRPVINSLEQAHLWLNAGAGPCDVMVDTGINRLGLDLSEVNDPVLRKLDVQLVLSHLACADEDHPLNLIQLEKAHNAFAAISSAGKSLASSAGIALGPDYHFDVTRPGLALYGGVPRSEMAEAIEQVAFPQAAVIAIRQVDAGASIGYNATFTAPRPMRTAVISLGYADGFLRLWAKAGCFQFENKILPLLGKISMDMAVVDCSAAPDISEGDWVTLAYGLPEASAATGLSQYELLTILGQRLHD
ncbi:alanine racemase [Altericroceibacterium spongiae]|uniref:alanine racemase n=1 Tax=Altericroceibacterium spongiae TaxID=2320269 RepID=A0A420ERX4_9SPHN|nr:alanine racemase [Altericroceibacterium spongiae]RKF23474.1 alanine racemase [Altericroceibacterium spongiae]